MFALSSVDIDGVAEPADDRGFTFATYMSGSILDISGTPAQAAVMSGMSLAVFCHAAEQMIFCARQCACLLTLCLAKGTSTMYKLSQQQHKRPWQHHMSAIACIWLHCVSAGQTDVKAVVDQEIAQEIARLEAKIDAVISTRLLAYDTFAYMVL